MFLSCFNGISKINLFLIVADLYLHSLFIDVYFMHNVACFLNYVMETVALNLNIVDASKMIHSCTIAI